MSAYYNEHNAHAAAWLRKLIKVGAIAPGEVDERSITDVTPSDLAGYRQCHFFAGIGGWSLALRLAGVPDDYPVWTGSCPCQPYSAAGKGKGDKDERNLWPEFFRLIRERRPVAVAGEQVAAAIRHGWLDGISADLEGEGYAVGAAVLGAHSVGSPHIRQRLYWVADSGNSECGGRSTAGWDAGLSLHAADGGADGGVAQSCGAECGTGQPGRDCEGGRGACRQPAGCGSSGGLVDAAGDAGPQQQREPWICARREASPDDSAEHSGSRPVADSDGQRFPRGPESHGIEEQPGEPASRRGNSGGCSGLLTVADATCERAIPAQQPGQRNGSVGRSEGSGSVGDAETHGREGRAATGQGTDGSVPSGAHGHWSDFDIIHCRDGKARRVGRGVFPLADGLPADLGRRFPELRRLLARARSGRTGRLKGYGNAIVPQVAAELVRAWMEIRLSN